MCYRNLAFAPFPGMGFLKASNLLRWEHKGVLRYSDAATLEATCRWGLVARGASHGLRELTFHSRAWAGAANGQ